MKELIFIIFAMFFFACMIFCKSNFEVSIAGLILFGFLLMSSEIRERK